MYCHTPYIQGYPVLGICSRASPCPAVNNRRMWEGQGSLQGSSAAQRWLQFEVLSTWQDPDLDKASSSPRHCGVRLSHSLTRKICKDEGQHWRAALVFCFDELVERWLVHPSIHPFSLTQLRVTSYHERGGFLDPDETITASGDPTNSSLKRIDPSRYEATILTTAQQWSSVYTGFSSFHEPKIVKNKKNFMTANSPKLLQLQKGTNCSGFAVTNYRRHMGTIPPSYPAATGADVVTFPQASMFAK